MLSRVKEITSPGWMHETSAQGCCTGKTQRDGMGREAGGGIRMGNTCGCMADSCQCMIKPLQYCKVISLQLIKINGGWGKGERENSPTPQFKSVNFSVLSSSFSFLHSPTLTSVHDHWKNHYLDQMDLCWQSSVSYF